MLTKRLWESLYSPHGTHSTYWAHILANRRTLSILRSEKRWAKVIPLPTFFVIALVFSGVWVFVVPFLPFILLGTSSLCGVLITTQISGLIAFEHQQKRYEVASMLPMGGAGVHWVISRVIVQNTQVIVYVQVVLGNLCLMVMLAMTGFLVLGGITLVQYFTILTALALIYADLCQSVISSVLVGMIAANQSSERLSAASFSVVLFLILQVCAYLLILVVCGFVLPLLIGGLTLVILQLLFALGIREGIITALWHATVVSLESTRFELEQTIRVAS
jgi:hypothetical protein